MKKILLILIILLYSKVTAAETANIRFIYLNGSNSNTEDKKQDFESGICDVQQSIKEVFESSNFICKTLLKKGKYKIDNIPYVFFWGFESKNDLAEANYLLEKTKLVSPFMAQFFRSLIVRNIHDILWIERSENMKSVINRLHQQVISFCQCGEKVILLGHSAGAFITYEYILNKVKDFNTNLFLPAEENKITCSDAIIASGMGIRLYDGKIIKNSNEEKLKNGYKNLGYFTKQECIPDGLILGVINFGSPQPLFYPDRLNELTNSSYIYQKNFIDYIKTHDLFYLTLNYAEDTLSLLLHSNYSYLNSGGGFIYTYMGNKSPSTFINAHYTYWKHPKIFAKMAKEGYISAIAQ